MCCFQNLFESLPLSAKSLLEYKESDFLVHDTIHYVKYHFTVLCHEYKTLPVLYAERCAYGINVPICV